MIKYQLIIYHNMGSEVCREIIKKIDGDIKEMWDYNFLHENYISRDKIDVRFSMSHGKSCDINLETIESYFKKYTIDMRLLEFCIREEIFTKEEVDNFLMLLELKK